MWKRGWAPQNLDFSYLGKRIGKCLERPKTLALGSLEGFVCTRTMGQSAPSRHSLGESTDSLTIFGGFQLDFQVRPGGLCYCDDLLRYHFLGIIVKRETQWWILGGVLFGKGRWNNAAWCSKGQAAWREHERIKKAFVCTHVQLVCQHHPYTNSLPTLKQVK